MSVMDQCPAAARLLASDLMRELRRRTAPTALRTGSRSGWPGSLRSSRTTTVNSSSGSQRPHPAHRTLPERARDADRGQGSLRGRCNQGSPRTRDSGTVLQDRHDPGCSSPPDRRAPSAGGQDARRDFLKAGIRWPSPGRARKLDGGCVRAGSSALSSPGRRGWTQVRRCTLSPTSSATAPWALPSRQGARNGSSGSLTKACGMPESGQLRLLQARRADIEFSARDLEARGRAGATITRAGTG